MYLQYDSSFVSTQKYKIELKKKEKKKKRKL